MLEQIASLIGAITGTVSLGGIVYLIGYWKGSVDTRIKAHEDQFCKYPPGEISLMCKTMWDIYVVEALRQRPDLAQHASPFKLTQQGQDLIPDSHKQALDQVKCNPLDREAVASGWLVVKYLGLTSIEQMAKEKSLSIQEAIAILSTYLVERLNNCSPQ